MPPLSSPVCSAQNTVLDGLASVRPPKACSSAAILLFSSPARQRGRGQADVRHADGKRACGGLRTFLEPGVEGRAVPARPDEQHGGWKHGFPRWADPVLPRSLETREFGAGYHALRGLGFLLAVLFARPAITKYYDWGGLNSRNVLSRSSRGWKSKIEVKTGLIPFEVREEESVPHLTASFAGNIWHSVASAASL